jgi:hypothetical protein
VVVVTGRRVVGGRVVVVSGGNVVVVDVDVVEVVVVDTALMRRGSSRVRLGKPATATPKAAPTTSNRARAHPGRRTASP